MASIGSRFKKAVNAFMDTDDFQWPRGDIGPSYGDRPDRRRIIFGSERTIITSIYSRIAIDVAMTVFEHVKMDDNDRFKETINSSLNQCLNVESNVDQTAFAFKVDAVYSMLEEGVIALVPIETSKNVWTSDSFDIYSMRTGKIVGWHPEYIDVRVYNQLTGQVEQITRPKSAVAIIENPFYAVMNEPNSTLKRLVYKLGLLDDADAKANSSKLDLIVQLPYTIRNDMQKKRVAERKKDIEMQLTGSKYGIAYIDATEHVTQLNRPIENTLMGQINDLTNQLYAQLGMDQTILNGTATSETMNNYYQRTIAPIIQAFREEMSRKWLTKTARTQHQTIMAFQDPFKYMTVTQIAQVVDTLSRNEVMAPNEFRTALGFKPLDDPTADEARNRNLIDVNATGEPAEEPVSDTSSETDNLADLPVTEVDVPVNENG